MLEMAEYAYRRGGAAAVMEIAGEEGWDTSPQKVKSLASNHGWTVNLAEKNYRTGKPPEYFSIIMENYEKVGLKGVMELLGNARIDNLNEKSVNSFAYKKGLRSPLHQKPNKGCFAKGQTPPNKDKPMSPELYQKLKRTFFQKNCTPGTTQYDGAVRCRKDKTGRTYLVLRVGVAKWVHFHRWTWETLTGKRLRPDQMVVFREGSEDFAWHPTSPKLRELVDTKGDQSVLDSIDPMEMLPHLEVITKKENSRRNTDYIKTSAKRMELPDHVVIGYHWNNPEYQETLKHSPALVDFERKKILLRRALRAQKKARKDERRNHR